MYVVAFKGGKAMKYHPKLDARLNRGNSTPEEILDYYTPRLETYLGLISKGAKLDYPNGNRLRKWAVKAVHAAYTLHPDLREDGTLGRYFVAKSGRKLGLRGEALSAYVENAYETGIYGSFIPEEIRSNQTLTSLSNRL